MMHTAGMDDGMSCLPEHLQHEVFSRVGDVKALFRFAATCRGWLHRFTDPAFLRELCHAPGSSSSHHHHHRARLLGVFLQDKSCLMNRSPCYKAMVQRASTTSSSGSCLAPVFLPALGSPLGPACRSLTSFVGGGGDDDDRTFDYAQLLAARRGIVLLQLRTPKEKTSCHRFAVCNPVTGDRHVLPPLEWNLAAGASSWSLVGYAIITAADSSSRNAGSARFTFSQLLVITQDEYPHRKLDVDARVHSYSAATRRWSVPTPCLDRRVFTLDGARSAVVHHGAAHWLCVDDALARWESAARGDDHHLYRLTVEVATVRVSLTRLPVRVARKQLLCVNSDDKLVVASMYPVHVTVWTPPGGGGGDDTTRAAAAAAAWSRTSFRITPHYNQHEMWFNFNHGSLLVLFRGDGGSSSVFILDLDTKVMEEVSIGILDFGNKAMGFLAARKWYQTSCVPYEMDLVDFFTLQLGGIRGRPIGSNNIS